MNCVQMGNMLRKPQCVPFSRFTLRSDAGRTVHTLIFSSSALVHCVQKFVVVIENELILGEFNSIAYCIMAKMSLPTSVSLAKVHFMEVIEPLYFRSVTYIFCSES